MGSEEDPLTSVEVSEGQRGQGGRRTGSETDGAEMKPTVRCAPTLRQTLDDSGCDD